MKKSLLVASLSVLAACSSSVEGARPDGDGLSPDGSSTQPEAALTFGESDDTASSDAEELFSKPPSNPNPKTLVGIYERTGYGSEDRPDQYVVLSNEWRTRLEIRPDKVVAAIECKLESGGATKMKETLYAYATSPVTVEPWGIRIEKAAKNKSTWDAFDVDCSVELPDETWPYCVGSDRTVPEGYSMCVYLNSGVELTVKRLDGALGSMGKKIRN